MIKYLLFDFDGVLYDARKLPMEQYLFQKALLFWQEKTQMTMHEVEGYAEFYWRKYGSSPIGFEKHQGVPVAAFGRDVNYSLFQKNEQLQAALEEISIPKVIFSNSNRYYIENALQRIGIRNQFSHIFCVDSARDAPKPDAEAFENVLSSLQVTPEECVFFEDNEKHLAVAQKMGFHTVYCNQDKELSFADYQINEMESQLIPCVNFFVCGANKQNLSMNPLFFNYGR